MTVAANDDLGTILRPIASTAASVEGAFLEAGDGLGRGLESFEKLGEGLSALSGELGDEPMRAATVAIRRVADELVSFSEHLPRATATLDGLHACSKTVSSRLDRLLDSMRTMTVLTRSARIEAVNFSAKGAEFADFTQEIGQLTRHVQAKVETSAREQAKLIVVLGKAARAQTALERNYRSQLLDLARELQETFATIQDRSQRSGDVARNLAHRSEEIAGAVRTAIMSLQSGDSTRQRLEHVHQGIELTLLPPVGSDEEAEAVRAAMYRLQAGQLRDTIASFDLDVGSIDGSLRRLIEDARDLVALGQAVYGEGDNSFLHTFAERMSDAAIVIQRCSGARDDVGGIIASVRQLFQELHSTIADLNAVIMDVVLIGINAGLKAGRLGTEGRSLVVIAQELKNTAGEITKDAKELLPVFEHLQALSRELDVPVGEAGRGIDADVASILDTINAGATRLASCLGTLAKTGQTFEGGLVRARRDFAKVLETRHGLVDAAAELDKRERLAMRPGAETVAVLGVVDQIMTRRYTMAREREIHAAILGEREPEIGATARAEAADDLEDVLF